MNFREINLYTFPALSRAFVYAGLAAASYAQSSALPAFDAADVHLSTLSTNPDTFVSGGYLLNGRFDLRRATLLDLIATAWHTDPGKVTGGPNWLAFDRFDIAAKAPPGTPPETINLMLQSLLMDRFNLILRNETRPFPAFALTRGTAQPRLKSTTGPPNALDIPGCQSQPQSGTPSYSVYACRDVSMAEFAGALRRMAADYLPAPVLDSTRLEGSWDFDLRWNPRSRLLPAGAERTTIFDALDKQLGLKLELQQVSTPVLVISHVNQEPTPNRSGLAQILPPRSREFDVAAVRLSAPDERFGHKRYPGGRLELHAFPMKMLISTAWDIDWDHMDERIAGAPKWIDSTRFDIVANTSTSPDSPQGAAFIDEDFQLMLRSLLTERFGISAHFEDRPVTAYALTAVKPRLKKADPANRSDCREAGIVAHDPRDANPARSRLIECQNMTMLQFSQRLRSMDRVEAAFNQVNDETGLKGAYDFRISFSPRSMLQREAVQEATSGVPAVSDPSGAISFFDAIRQQLGLKLEMRRQPMPVLVIDHIEPGPAPN